jgi:hypothetical protein
MYVEDVSDPDEVLLPSYNFILVALGAEKSGCHIQFTPFDDVHLDFGYSSAIETSVSGSFGVHTVGSTHVVSCPIAPSTDRLRSSNRLPSTPRSRA